MYRYIYIAEFSRFIGGASKEYIVACIFSYILPVRFMTFPHRDQVALQGEANVGLSIMQSEFSIMQQRRVSCVGGRHTPYVTATGAVRMEVSFETFCSRVEMSRGGQAA